MKKGALIFLICLILIRCSSCGYPLSPSSPPGSPTMNFRDLGPTVDTLGISGTVFTKSPQGELLLYFATHNEDPIRLGVYNFSSRRIDRVIPLPMGMTAWGMTELEGTIYIGAYKGTSLPRMALLYAFDPASSILTKAAEIPNGPLIWDMAPYQGKIYVATDPDSVLFEYEPGNRTLRNLGSVVPGETFIRSLAVGSNGTAFAGLGSRAYVAAIDLVTGRKTDITPHPLAGESIIYSLKAKRGRIFLGTEPGGKFLVMNEATNALEGVFETESTCVDTICAADEDKVYLTTRPTGRLLEYDITTRSLTALATPVFQCAATRGLFAEGDWISGISANAFAWQYNRKTKETISTSLRTGGMPGVPGYPMTMTLGPDNKLYVGGHWALAAIDPRTGKRNTFPFSGEPKAMAAAGRELFIAAYPNVALWKYEPAKPWSVRGGPADNPRFLGSLEKDEQNRPWALSTKNDLVFIGTSPEYGKMGGALVIYSANDNVFHVHRNIVPDQSVYALAVHGDKLYGGTSVFGGEGVDPKAKAAVVFVWDIKNQKKIAEIVPVPDQLAIYALVVSREKLIGLTNGGYVFILDLKSGTLRSKKHFDGVSFSYFNQKPSLIATPGGTVFGTTGSAFFLLDPEENRVTMIREGETGHMAALGSRIFVTIGKHVHSFKPES
jgi:hypothetical protein